MNNISELKNSHKGYDIYVVGSGPSTGYIEPSFFDNKIAIGINQVWKRFNNLDYVVLKDAICANGAKVASKSMGFKLIVSRHSCGVLKCKKNSNGADYMFDHQDNKYTEIDLDVIGTDKIVVSYSTITSAIHIAAYMGASNIILVGHDCGLIDGKTNIPVYPKPPQGDKRYLKFLQEIEPQTLLLRERIKKVYQANIYSLNPFINFGLEGHKYSKAINEN